MTNPRIGILGGTFNPVHHGHIDLGRRIRESFRLDTVYYVLSARPPHKNSRRIAAPDLRYRMLHAALRPYAPYLLPSDIELRRAEPSYTITTLAELRQQMPQAHFFFITGSDGFLKIRTWKEYRQVLQQICFIIVLRRLGHRTPVINLLHEEKIPYIEGRGDGEQPPMAFITSYRSPLLSISSTLVRRRNRSGGDVLPLVDGKVKAIMEDHQLYETN